jgi:hypothetical protein
MPLQLDQLDSDIRGHVERATEGLIGEFRGVFSPDRVRSLLDQFAPE